MCACETYCDTVHVLMFQVGQRVAEMMADAFRKEGGLDVNFVKVVQVNNAGTVLI